MSDSKDNQSSSVIDGEVIRDGLNRPSEGEAKSSNMKWQRAKTAQSSESTTKDETVSTEQVKSDPQEMTAVKEDVSESEVVTSSATEYAKHAPFTPAEKAEKMDASNVNENKKTQKTSTTWLAPTIKWGGSLAVIVAALIYTRPDQDWQVQKINQLQESLANLKAAYAELSATVAAQTSASQEADKQMSEFTRQLNALSEKSAQIDAAGQGGWASKESLQALQNYSQKQWQNLKAEMQSTIDQLRAAVPSLAGDEKLETVAPKVATETVVEEIKPHELMSSAPAVQAIPPLTILPDASNPLTSLQIQQWLLAINGQWMVSANVAMTKEQLLTIESAIGLSDFKEKALFSRTVGKDIAYLERFESLQQQVPSTQSLVALVNELNISKTIKPATTELAGDVAAETNSSWQLLSDKLSQMVTIQKRTEDEQQTKVESLLLIDVMRQRVLFYIDRIDWALQSQNQVMLERSVNELKAYVEKHFTQNNESFIQTLQRFKQIEFIVPKPLGVANVMGRIEQGGD